mmetsp:Transcript_1517/g.6018  ORF Transcript_1517/g.6018 Transcript_1517/m.6018 type:complete len:270 (+) Transcript_1517:518-1327(+)
MAILVLAMLLPDKHHLSRETIVHEPQVGMVEAKSAAFAAAVPTSLLPLLRCQCPRYDSTRNARTRPLSKTRRVRLLAGAEAALAHRSLGMLWPPSRTDRQWQRSAWSCHRALLGWEQAHSEHPAHRRRQLHPFLTTVKKGAANWLLQIRCMRESTVVQGRRVPAFAPTWSRPAQGDVRHKGPLDHGSTMTLLRPMREGSERIRDMDRSGSSGGAAGLHAGPAVGAAAGTTVCPSPGVRAFGGFCPAPAILGITTSGATEAGRGGYRAGC